MKKSLKIGFVMLLIILGFASIFIWKFLGNPYYKLTLIGTEYIENTEELKYAMDDFYLIKKYKYSEDHMLFGFGGGSSVTDDYYLYGLADKNKDVLIEPIYQLLYARPYETEASVFEALPYYETGKEEIIYYYIVGNEVKIISKEELH